MKLNSIKSKLKVGSLVLGSVLLAANTGVAFSKDLNIMLWGATWQTGIQAASEDFTKQTGIKINLVPQASSGEGLAKLQAMKNKPTVDVWFTTASLATKAQEDKELFGALPKDQINNLNELADGAATDYYAPIYSYPTSIIYRPDLVDGPITSWADLWDKKFEKKLAMPAMGFFQGRLLMIAAGKDGGDPMNEEYGFAELEKLKPNVTMFFGSDSQARQALAQGEAAVTVGPPSHGKRIADAGFDVKVISPKPTVMNYDVMMIVNSGKESESAQFINYMLSKEVNEKVAYDLGMGAVNVNSVQPDYLQDQLPKPEDEFIPDESIVNENIARWLDIYKEKIAH